MNSERNEDFNRLYFLLPSHVRKLAVKTYRLWRANPWHPSLRFKETLPGEWSIRIGKQYRAIGTMSSMEGEGESIVWHWIGSHNAYDKWLREKR